jgi:hypothetical protein
LSKYHTAPKEERTWRGKVYDSKLEMTYAHWVWMMVGGGDLAEVVEQPKVRLGEDFTYRPDFLIIPNRETPYYVDTKGAETREFKKTTKLWMKYGRLDLHIVKAGGGCGFHTDRVIGDCKHRPWKTDYGRRLPL